MAFRKADFLHNFATMNKLRKESFFDLMDDLEELLITDNDFNTWINVRKKKYKYIEDITPEYIASCLNFTHHKRDMDNRKIAFAVLKSANVILDWRKKKWSILKFQIKVEKNAYFELKTLLQSLEKDTLNIPAYRLTNDKIAICIDGVDEPIRTPYFEKENDKVFQYVYENPNRVIDRMEIKEKTGVDKDLNKIFTELGFVNKLGDIFIIGKSKYNVGIRNPVYYKDLYKLGIEYIEPEELVKMSKRKMNKVSQK